MLDFVNRQRNTDNSEAAFTFIDLFAGIGGMRIAYQNAGGRCVYSNEWNKYSQQTYFANFGEQPDGDITKVDARTIPDYDILVAGFPCQPFSIAGVSKKNSLGRATGFEDKTQGTLFFDVCRVLKAKRPKAFMPFLVDRERDAFDFPWRSSLQGIPQKVIHQDPPKGSCRE